MKLLFVASDFGNQIGSSDLSACLATEFASKKGLP